MSDFICGANEAGFHYTGVNWGRDLPEPEIADLRNVVAGDPSPDGQGVLAIQRGIEVGHVFAGLPYADTMNLNFTDEDGTTRRMFMGCYGIGVTRLLGAAIEQNHDDKGIIWPTAMAPFHVVLCPIGADRSEAVRDAAQQLYKALEAAQIDVIWDDRGERPGAMFADWELIGVPYRLTLGDRGLKEGKVEFQHRRDAAATPVLLTEAAALVIERVRADLSLV
jgi:prolyl-tRNA synthetase